MKKIGILGGGQLALMMLPSIKALGYTSVILDTAQASCHELADELREGSFSEPSDCLKLADCEVVTFEIESISLDGYKKLAERTKVHPSPFVLSTIQDKGLQKEFFKRIDVPTSSFSFETINTDSVLPGKVVKLRTGGYDGKGVWVSRGESPPESFINLECLVEERVEIDKEVAVVCSRGIDGSVVVYEMVEMVMDPELNLLDYQLNPAEVSSSIKEKAEKIVRKIVDELDYVGTLAVEFFVDVEEKLWVNELAPRVHNSGHNTIESAPCSQFENHIRAITGNKLGATLPAKPSLTMNLIGVGAPGKAKVKGAEKLEKNVHLHLYNKKESRPGRKMGHITVLGEKNDVIQLKDKIKQQVIITGEDQ